MKFFKLWILYYKHFLKDFIATKSSYHIYLNGFFLKRNYFKTFSREIRFLTGTGIQKLLYLKKKVFALFQFLREISKPLQFKSSKFLKFVKDEET